MSDRYLIYEQLGAGGGGAVFRAYDSQLRRWVAIKRLTNAADNGETSADIQEQLRQEADSLASLRHPNIVTIFDVASDEQGLFMVMELLEGEDLAHVVARGPLPFDDFKELARQTLEGLIAAHERHILHRDIKPENIKVERLPGGRLQAKIIDFGLARVGLRARKQTEDVDGTVMGSIHYMAPEQLTREPIDERTDLYSLGCVFYEALSGQKAFDGSSMSEVIDKHINHEVSPLHAIAPHVPPWLGAWVERLMAPRPADRPASAQQAIDDFRAWERMPAMVPYMPWMAAPNPVEQAYYAAPVEEAIPVVPIAEPSRSPTAPRQPRPAARAPSARLAPRTGPQAPRGRPVIPAPKKRSKAPLLSGLLFVILGTAYFLMRSGKTDRTADSPASDTAASPSSPAYELPIDRLMPPLDADLALYVTAGVGTLGAGKSSDGKPFPAYVNDSVMRWHDVAPRGRDNVLSLPEGAGALPAKRVVWPVAAEGPSVKGNRAALQLRAGSSKAPVLEGRFKSNAAAFPFGSDTVKGPRGASLALVFQAEASAATVLVTAQGSGGGSLRLETTAGKGLAVVAASSGGQARLESSGIDVTLPTIAVASWEAGSGKLHLLAINPAAKSGGKIPLFQQTAPATAGAPSEPLDHLAIGPCNALIAELLLYASALDEEQRRLLGNTQLRNYYFK